MLRSLSLLALAAAAQAVDTPYALYTFNETSGTVAHDTGSRGSAGDATLFGYDSSTSWTTIGGRSVLAFNGSSNYLRSLVALPAGSMAYTIQARVMFTNNTPNSTIVKNWGSSAVGAFHFGLDWNSGVLSNYIGTDPLSAVTGTNQVPFNQWLTLTVSYDGGIGGSNLQRLFINGQLIGSNAAYGSASVFGTYMFIGAKGNDAGDGIATGDEGGWFQGYMDQLAFYTTEVSPVPEPSTYGLALGGLALVAVAVRRRRNKSSK